MKTTRQRVVSETSTTQCVKVDALRKKYGKDITLEKWMKDPKNMYVGRRGRIFIKEKDGSRIFHYRGSKWANPYKVGSEYSLEKSIELYTTYILDNEELLASLDELKGKNLGCFCDQKGLCHAKVLVEILSTLSGPKDVRNDVFLLDDEGYVVVVCKK